MENVNDEGSEIIYGVFPYKIKKDNLTYYPGLHIILKFKIEEAIELANNLFNRKINKLEGVEVMLCSNKKDQNWELIYSIWKA